MHCDVDKHLYVVACQILMQPSSEPVRMTGSSGWNTTADTLFEWPSSVCTHALVW